MKDIKEIYKQLFKVEEQVNILLEMLEDFKNTNIENDEISIDIDNMIDVFEDIQSLLDDNEDNIYYNYIMVDDMDNLINELR